MKTTVDRTQLKSLIKESIREVLDAEFIKFRAFLVPQISPREQKDIERRYGKPTKGIAKVIREEL